MSEKDGREEKSAVWRIMKPDKCLLLQDKKCLKKMNHQEREPEEVRWEAALSESNNNNSSKSAEK